MTPTVTSCADIDATGIDRDDVDTYVATWDGSPCAAPLAGGDPGGWMSCGYGGDPGVCGQSSGLSLMGCRCESDGTLTCRNGVVVAQHEEEVACPGGAG